MMKPSGFISEMVEYANTRDHLIIQPQNSGHHYVHDQYQPWNNNNIELSDWIEQITKHLIDDDVVSQASEDSFVNSSDFRPRKIPRTIPVDQQNEKRQRQQIRNNSNSELHRVESDELTLLTLLMESAVAISVGDLGGARQILLEISESASPHAPSCAERVVAYFAQAMSSRVVASWLGAPSSPAATSPSMHNYQTALARDALAAFAAASPLVKSTHLAANQVILEALRGQPFVHVVDLDAAHCPYWPVALLRLLAARPEGPPRRVRLTAVGPSTDALVSTGESLSSLAERLGLFAFEFSALPKRPGETLDASAVGPRRGEALAVHWLRHGLYDAAGPDREAMAAVGDLRPRVFTVVERDVVVLSQHGGGSFLDRFVGSLHYYSTVFDSLGAAAVGPEDQARHVAESRLLYGEVCNALAAGDRLRSWRRELGGAGGFAQVAVSGSAAAQARAALSGPGRGGFSLAEEEGCVRVGWKGTSLYTVSAWTTTCTDHNNPNDYTLFS